MNGLVRRVEALEARGTGELSPLVRQWLGQPITEAERAALDDDRAGVDPDFDNLSDDARDWLT